MSPQRLLTKVEELEQFSPPYWLSESNYRGWQRLPEVAKAAINFETDVKLQGIALLEVLPVGVRKDVLRQVREARPDIALVLERVLRP